MFLPFSYIYFLETWCRYIRRNGQQYQHVLAFCASFNRGNTDGTNSLKICVCMYCIFVVFYLFCFTFV